MAHEPRALQQTLLQTATAHVRRRLCLARRAQEHTTDAHPVALCIQEVVRGAVQVDQGSPGQLQRGREVPARLLRAQPGSGAGSAAPFRLLTS